MRSIAPPEGARRAAVAILSAGALLIAGCSDGAEPDVGSASDRTEPSGVDGSTTTTGAEAVEDEGPEAEAVEDDAALYEVPDPLPEGAHGDLVRYQELEETTVEGATTYRVMYLSESIQGDPIVVTGTVVVPTGEAPEGGRPVLAIAHGTTGIADECAPSTGSGAAELAISAGAVERGWILAVTDYEGLGTPGRHPYLVGESEGRGVLDSVLAAGSLPDAQRSDTTLIAGYSQGGHGALWAGEIAEEWTPELAVVGTFAGAPATELDVILAASGSPGVAGFAALIVAGFAAAYPDEADPATILTDAGVEALDAVDEGCTGDVFGAVNAIPGGFVRPDGPASEPWPELARDNNPGQVVTEAPILIIHSAQDDVVPATLSEILFGRMCEGGQVVERRVLPDGGSHGEAAVVAYPDALTWFDGLLDGEDPVDTCP